MVELVAMLVLIGLLVAAAAPRFVRLSESVKKKASAAGIAELNAREKQLWNRAVLVDDSAVVASDEAIDRDVFESMDFNLNSGSAADWAYRGGSWSAEGISATLVFKEVESGIWRYPATLDQPGRWKFSENIGRFLFSGFTSVDDFSDAWGGADGTWTVDADGALLNNGSAGFMHIAGTEGENYRITLDATLNSGNGYGILYNSTKTGSWLPDGYGFQFDPGLGDQFVARNFSNGSESVIKSVKMADIFGSGFDLNATHEISVSVINNNHTISVDGQVVLEFSDSSHTSGSVGARTWGSSDAVFENVQVIEQ